jgi:ATP-dependent Clp endopeptidase proteolytic subunit ClpP
MRPCFKFIAAASADQPATLSIYDEIGFWGVQAKDFIGDLRAVTSKVINVEINSPGGDVFAGLAIYNALKSSGKEIVVKVMGVAASAASLIAMAGDKIVMPKNTFMMVHNPWSFASGNAEDLRGTADTLDKIGASLQATYAARTGQTEDKIKELLSKDTWLTADESLELGFATEVVDAVTASASFDMARADLPEAVRGVFKAALETTTETTTETENSVTTTETVTVTETDGDTPDDSAPAAALADQIAALAKTAGLEAYASVFALGSTVIADATARIAAAREIVALCKVAGRPDDAPAAIAANKSIADVRAALIAAKADDDQHTDTSKPNQAGTSASSSGVSPQKVWNSHNAQNAPKKGRK